MPGILTGLKALLKKGAKERGLRIRRANIVLVSIRATPKTGEIVCIKFSMTRKSVFSGVAHSENLCITQTNMIAWYIYQFSFHATVGIQGGGSVSRTTL